MRTLLVVAALLLATPLVFAANNGVVRELTLFTFDETFGPGGATGTNYLLSLVSPSCVHCQELKPTLHELAASEAVRSNKNVGGIVTVDCLAAREVCLRFNPIGYPSIYLIDGNGAVYEHKGDRSLATLTALVESSPDPSTATIASIPSRGMRPDGTPQPPPPKPAADASDDMPDGKQETLVFNDKTFDKKLGTAPTFIKFYAPWCGHCKKLAPAWETLARELKANKDRDKRTRIAKVDCTPEGGGQDTCQRFGIAGYPTLKLFRDGKIYDYEGAREIDALRTFVEGGYASAKSSDMPLSAAEAKAQKLKDAREAKKAEKRGRR